MAEEIIATTVIALLEKTIAAAADRFGLVPGFKDELTKMEGLVRDIQARIADAESKQSEDPIVLRWLKDFKGAALEAEIVLDELHYEDLRREVHKFKRGGSVAKVCSFFSLFTHDVSFRVRMSHKVRDINVMLEDIKQKAQDLELAMLKNRDPDVTAEAANRPTDSSPEQFVAGRSKEETAIVDMLLLGSSNDNNPSVSVLPIVGMGGLGKTTLAKSIYNSEKIVNHFSKRSWICVSDKFVAVDIFKGILESLKRGSSADISSRDEFVRGIQKELNGERFLFVLDDVWNKDSILWDSFYTSLDGLNSASGSCCVLTTREQITANIVSTSSFKPFVLDKLSGDDCWFIIGRKATKGGEMPPEFEIHKEEILKKCQGLPLAAKAIGGLLSSQREEDWVSAVEALKVRNVVNGDIMPILKLSYDYLPYPHIKKCFAYCSVYPKDALMKGHELIELWMAEGYLQDDMHGRTLMEEDGDNCLKLLLQSSLLEKKDTPFGDDLYQLHDLVHDLAESISERKQHDGDRSRHLAIGETVKKYNWNEKSTLIQVVEGGLSGKMLLKYRHAHVMHLWSGEIKKLPNAISKLKHIRCLTLSFDGIKSLPESLCKLYNLQTLRLSDCKELGCLPQGLSNLISLRHLHFRRGGEFKMAPHMGRLTSLQTLEFFNVGEENGHRIEELGSLENLKDSLKIRNLELVKSEEEATSAKLFQKKKLTTLALNWGWTTGRNNDNWEDVLEGLEPCPGLLELRIESFMGVRFPRWLGNSLALVSLQLYYCKNMTELGYSGDTGFPNLKTLHISVCPQLSSVRTSFPILEELHVLDIQVSTVRDIISKSGTNSLQDLSLCRVSGMTCLSDVIESSLSSCLTRLVIWGRDELTEIPSSTLECCTCLESLLVFRCRELVSFPLNLQQTPSLSSIEISDCPKLFTRDAVLPRGFQHLTNLKQLHIGPDNSEQSIDWEGLRKGCSTTLRHLTMSGSSRTQLPQQLQDFSSLVKLTIIKFDSLERLPGWLGKLTSLQRLHLLDCPKLEHLPTDAIGSLTNLHRLEIRRCPLLRETQGDEIKKALPKHKVDWPDYQIVPESCPSTILRMSFLSCCINKGS